MIPLIARREADALITGRELMDSTGVTTAAAAHGKQK